MCKVGSVGVVHQNHTASACCLPSATQGECSITGFVFVGVRSIQVGFFGAPQQRGSGGEWLSVRWKTSAAVACLLMTLVMQPESGCCGVQTKSHFGCVAVNGAVVK